MTSLLLQKKSNIFQKQTSKLTTAVKIVPTITTATNRSSSSTSFYPVSSVSTPKDSASPSCSTAAASSADLFGVCDDLICTPHTPLHPNKNHDTICVDDLVHIVDLVSPDSRRVVFDIVHALHTRRNEKRSTIHMMLYERPTEPIYLSSIPFHQQKVNLNVYTSDDTWSNTIEIRNQCIHVEQLPFDVYPMKLTIDLS